LFALERFLRIEAASGLVLLACTAVALFWANSPVADSYRQLWDTRFTAETGAASISWTLQFVVNDVLMTVFFLVVGMEIRREMHAGALASLRVALLPLAAAVGGICVPALIYLSIVNESSLSGGWAVPTATDIAFAAGVLAMLGKSVPVAVRVFLLALAVIDDVAAVLIIAMFYSGGIDVRGLLVGSFALVLIACMRRLNVGSAAAYLVPGAVLWVGMLIAGIHPTLAGVVLGLLTPAAAVQRAGTLDDDVAPVTRIQELLHPWVAFGIMPLFALANAGVTFGALRWDDETARALIISVTLALVVGKPLGIFLGSWVAVRLRWCDLPSAMSWYSVWVVGCLGGIGFTMSIFIAMLAFEDTHLLNTAKIGVITASVIAAGAGLLLGRSLTRER
jgi:NhaA family Na+:H+ antiporter